MVQAGCNLLFISYQRIFPWGIKLLDCEVITHHLAPWVRLWSFIHSTIHSLYGALPFTIFPLFEIVLHAHKYTLHCIWSFYSTVVHICKSRDFLTWIYEKNVSLIHLKICMVGGGEWLSEWVGVALKLCRKWNTCFVGIFVNIVACEHGYCIRLLSRCLIHYCSL